MRLARPSNLPLGINAHSIAVLKRAKASTITAVAVSRSGDRRTVQHDDQWQPQVNVTSPDRTVRLLADRSGQLAVEVQDLHRHTEDSLAGQIRAAARVALASLQDRGSDADLTPAPAEDPRWTWS
ncbi:hypothetical protein GCM10010435_37450 [Winogradskya consettensis]|uniref:Uncharacterized protein n=1 Tax=Winogradskya consettensis TaxID=113560 RepID=A0A919T2Z9_9ACTN|nr:hypothetical protein Aco04nite_88650 [Actinoplanes consettensis]